MDFEFVKTYGLDRKDQITLVRTFVEELWKSFELLQSTMEAKDVKLARVYSHKIQGSSKMVGLLDIAEEAKEINSLLHKDQWGWQNKLQAMMDKYPQIQVVADEFCS